MPVRGRRRHRDAPRDPWGPLMRGRRGDHVINAVETRNVTDHHGL